MSLVFALKKVLCCLPPCAGGLDRRPHASPCGHRWCAASHRPDNAKVAVIKACLYEPQVNRSYAEMAAHRGFLSASALIYRRLPSANDKCPLNSFLDVRNKLLVA
jgi:putative component of membrane protein insertase Oxa1/YidC/SpoIIIJ protein YidD